MDHLYRGLPRSLFTFFVLVLTYGPGRADDYGPRWSNSGAKPPQFASRKPCTGRHDSTLCPVVLRLCRPRTSGRASRHARR
jgi:hypothetical protein